MTMSDLFVEGPRAWPGTSDHQFDSAGLTEAHRDSERATRQKRMFPDDHECRLSAG